MPKGFISPTAGKHYDGLVKSAKDRKRLNEEVFVENSDYARHHIKKRCIDEKLIEYKCSSCGINDEWNDIKLTLQLEHINGISNDNRIENLTFLCPNCHSQTKTYAAKNRKNPNRTLKQYIDRDGVLRNIPVRESGNPQVSKTLRTQFDSEHRGQQYS